MTTVATSRGSSVESSGVFGRSIAFICTVVFICAIANLADGATDRQN